jgi:large subunit ribosomal protein LP0
MPAVKKTEKRIKKEAYWTRLQVTAAKYKNVLFVDANNVSSKQIGSIRRQLRAIGAVMIMGKNTLMKASLTEANTAPVETDDDYATRKETWAPNANIPLIISQLTGNVNLIFTNGDLSEVKDVLDAEVRPSPAKAGMVAPDNVAIPAGPTGLDPKKTSFFQTLQIQTKIVKAQIDIAVTKQVIFEGEKINSTQAALLDLLKIYPFEYKMQVTKILQDGELFSASVLDLSVAVILAKFKANCKTQASLSLGAGFATSVSAPHSLLNGFKNLLAASIESGYTFDQSEAFTKKK